MKAIYVVLSILCLVFLFSVKKAKVVAFTDPSAISVKGSWFLISNPPGNVERLLSLVSEHLESLTPNDTLAGYSYYRYRYYKETWFTRRNHKSSGGESFSENFLYCCSDDLLIEASWDPRHNIYTATLYGRNYRKGGEIQIIEKIWKKECPLAHEQDIEAVPRNGIETRSDASAAGLGIEEIGGAMIDFRDGQKYRTGNVGGRIWMRENLNYKMANSWCYDHSESYCNKFGRLYDWNTAKKACPNGWHLPSREDWKDFVATVKTDYAGNTLTMSVHDLLDQRGGYYRFFEHDFNGSYNEGNWWTSTTNEGGLPCSIYTNSYFTSPIEAYLCHICNGFSVRCVQDIAE
jgi:uncharacterized protein (TIGR02145 family)